MLKKIAACKVALQDHRCMDLEMFQDQIGYRFQDARLLSLALTHPSAARKLKDNQRLEFLGDAVLQMAVSQYLYSRYPNFAEGRLTELRAASVNRSILARVSQTLGVGKILIMGRGEIKNGGRTKESNLADALEALIGAVFVDSDFATARDWVVDHYLQEIDLEYTDSAEFNPKGELQEKLQASGLPTPTYEVVEEQGPDHSKQYHVVAISEGRELGRGSGPSKKGAEQEAARAALEAINRSNG